ncbi:hypothetical protein CCACVL1_10044 [Corchorus capsularis]|uniref:F-box domain-containing protein n=1 Tax=Corchorus capsularis TaxID=210143 RepID=A0A1R3IT54_COCAP|nr:hypothetical protein CCACVL1_10044 [Corchorus capsularis]
MRKVPQLPQEIIANILSRLPVKHLIQLKCVSKPWRSLISDPQFAKLHLKAQSHNHRVLLLTEPLESAACEASDDDLEDIKSKLIREHQFPAAMKKTPDSDELVDDHDGWFVSGGSCNGLICVVIGTLIESKRIFIWNPTIREANELAKLSDFDPKGTFSYGLGYDSSIDDYKVVRIARSSTATASDEAQVEILALKSNIWRRIQSLQPGIEIKGPMGPEYAGIFLHGALHWLAAITKTGSKTTYAIVAFDMVNENFYELVPLPDQIEESKYDTLGLGISGDNLCLFCGCGWEDVMEAWLLKEYGIKSSWTRLFNVDRQRLFEREIEYDEAFYTLYYENVLCYTNSGKLVIDHDGRALIWHDPKENTFKSFSPENGGGGFTPVIYIESLVSPNSYSATNMQTTIHNS